jgi:hypothetical protein
MKLAIGGRLFVRIHAVAYHLRRVFQYLGVSSRRELSGACTDSKALYCSAGWGGRRENWVDETAQWGTRVDRSDEKHHLAKVRVAGSNPVFRPIVAVQSWFLDARGLWAQRAIVTVS